MELILIENNDKPAFFGRIVQKGLLFFRVAQAKGGQDVSRPADAQ